MPTELPSLWSWQLEFYSQGVVRAGSYVHISYLASDGPGPSLAGTWVLSTVSSFYVHLSFYKDNGQNNQISPQLPSCKLVVSVKILGLNKSHS